MGAYEEFYKGFHPDFADPRKKPVGPVEIDWSNPLTENLKHFWLIHPDFPARDLVTGNDISSLTNASYLRRGLIDTNASSEIDIPDSTITYPYTIAARLEFESTSGSRIIFAKDGNNYGVFFSGSTVYHKTGGSHFTWTSSQAVGDRDTWILNRHDGTNASLFKNSEKIGDDTIGSAGSSSLQLKTICRSSYTIQAKWEFVAVWDGRSLTDAESKSLAEFPFQVIKPAIPQYLFLSSGGGGGPTPVAKDLTLQWSILQTIQKDATLQWGIFNAVSKDADLQWSILNSVSKNPDLRWSILNSVGKDVDLRWHILNAVNNDATLSWGILSTAAKDMDLRWDILNSVFSDADLRWSVLEAVAKDMDLRWDVDSSLATVSKDLTLQWNILATVQKSLTLQWDMLNTITRDADLRWTILNALSKDVSLQWAILQSAGKDMDLRWDVLAATAKEITLRWNIQSDNQFPDITGEITISSNTPVFTIDSLTPKITIH